MLILGSEKGFTSLEQKGRNIGHEFNNKDEINQAFGTGPNS